MSPIRDAVLILTVATDPTADLVHDRLREMDQPVVRFDSAAFPSRAQLSMASTEDGWSYVLESDAGDIDLTALRSIWYRRPTSFVLAEGMTPDTEAFARAECREAFSGALHSSPARWVNPPGPEAKAALKPYQLRAARHFGLHIPDTLITNKPAEARAFLDDRDGSFIYKRLSPMLLYTEDRRLTGFQTELVDPQAKERLEQVAVAPCLFQRYVPKRYEIRCTVVDGRAFSAKVDSQSSATENGRLDWRMDDDLTWTAYRLPESVEQRLIDLVRSMGLVFGAIDLFRRPDGEYVFLEINPGGQWAWFSDDVTHPIRDALVEALLSPRAEPASSAPRAA